MPLPLAKFRLRNPKIMEALGSAIIAITVGAFIVLGATVTQQQERLCNALGGTYNADRNMPPCEGGAWVNLITRAAPRQ